MLTASNTPRPICVRKVGLCGAAASAAGLTTDERQGRRESERKRGRGAEEDAEGRTDKHLRKETALERLHLIKS